MSPMKPAITLQNLRERLDDKDLICIGLPPPAYRKCQFKRSELCDSCIKLIDDQLNTLAKRDNLTSENFDDLKYIAEILSCKTHIKRGDAREFAHFWLAQSFLPSFFDVMGFSNEIAEWVCLASSESPCEELKCKENDGTAQRAVYASLHKLAHGEDTLAEDAIEILIKYWLCDTHKDEKEKRKQREALRSKIVLKAWLKNTNSLRNQTPDRIESHFDRRTGEGAISVDDGTSDDEVENNSPCGQRAKRIKDNKEAPNFTERVSEVGMEVNDPRGYKTRAASTTSTRTLSRPPFQLNQSAPAPGASPKISPEAINPIRKKATGSNGMIQTIPDFKPKNVSGSPSPIINNVLDLMRKTLDPTDRKRGQIYIFKIRGRTDLVKIGSTLREVSKRKKEVAHQIKIAGIEATERDSKIAGFEVIERHMEIAGLEVNERVFTTKHHKRVEKLIQAELGKKEHSFLGPLKSKRVFEGTEETLEKLMSEHGELFQIDDEKALRIVKKWIMWMRLKPYSSTGKLKGEWNRKLDSYWDFMGDNEDGSAGDLEGEPFKKLLGKISCTSIILFHLSQIFSGTSNDWKDSFIFFVGFYILRPQILAITPYLSSWAVTLLYASLAYYLHLICYKTKGDKVFRKQRLIT